MLMMAEDDRQKPLNNLSEDANDDRLLNGKERQGPKVPQERDQELDSEEKMQRDPGRRVREKS